MLNEIYLDLQAQGINDIKIIGIGKDGYASSLDGMINDRILPWVQDSIAENYPVWNEYDAAQREGLYLST